MYIYNKLINSFIKKGFKQKSENTLLNVLKKIKRKKKADQLSLSKILNNIVYNCSTEFELRSSSGFRNKTKYPCFVEYKRNKRITIKSITKSVIKRTNNNLYDNLFDELSDALDNKGFTVKKKWMIYFFVRKNRLFLNRFFSPRKGKKRRKIRF